MTLLRPGSHRAGLDAVTAARAELPAQCGGAAGTLTLLAATAADQAAELTRDLRVDAERAALVRRSGTALRRALLHARRNP
jgi:hypothetical protein